MKRTLIISTERQLLRNSLWIELIRQDVNAFLYLPSEEVSVPDSDENFQDVRSRVLRSKSFTPRNSSPTLRIDFSLRKLVERHRIQRIHLVGEPWGIPAFQATSLTDEVIIHGAENKYSQGNKLKDELRKLATRRALKRTRGFIGWHQSAIDAAQQAGLPQTISTAVMPGQLPNPNLFLSERVNHLADDEKLRIITVGRLVKEKGVDVLLRALSSCAANVHLTVVGTGPEENHLKVLAKEMQVTTDFLGWQNQQQLKQRLATAHVMAACSRETPKVKEQFGLAVLEGMMSGLPIIASNVGALPDLVGSAGVIFRDGDVSGLTMQVKNLISKRSEVNRLSVLALARAEEFSTVIIAKRIREFWSKCD